MDWFAPIDAYCERLGPGLAAEPFNALSNAAFFIAALWAARTAARKGVEPVIWLLIALVFVIGLGSLAFHTFADQWSELADVLPITLFIYGYLAFALRRFLGLDWWKVALALGVLFLVTLASAHVLPPGFMNGSGAYLPALIASVHATLTRVRGDMGAIGSQPVEAEPAKPAVPVKKSVTPDYLICLEDGKKFKSLKRHLRTHYNMSPEEYREKWGLPADYPMVAPNYAAARSNLARSFTNDSK